ncbi:hypothetical protein [Evansella halocellulosilytica]|uniref:hypothetical protein n=1 Tax=Evansella halocellulosilytica TaxID=2011013 RepID=UPI000BB76C49|nr:hypothetical protein [Evansella halocellulosilytica]
MNRFEDTREFDEEFHSLSRKITLKDKEKKDILHQVNEKMDDHSLKVKRKEHRSYYPYYAAYATAILLLVIIFSPTIIQLSEQTGFNLSQIENIRTPDVSITMLIPLFILLLFSVPGFICFYYAFKPHQHDDDSFLDLFGYETILTLIFMFLLWVCKKILPKNLYVTMFRIIVICIGIVIFYLIFIFWMQLN